MEEIDLGLGRMLKVADVAKALGVSGNTIYKLIESKDIPHLRIGGGLRIPYEGVRKYLAARCEGFEVK